MNEIVFGDRNEFKICYIPNCKTSNDRFRFASIHMKLDQDLIGDSRENSLVLTWISKVEQLLVKLKNNFKTLSHKEFKGRTNQELFYLLMKSNQLEEEYESAYQYLPALSNDVWKNCHVHIDETMDAYLIFTVACGKKIKFIWKRESESFPSKETEVKSVEVDRNYVINTLNECLIFLKSE